MRNRIVHAQDYFRSCSTEVAMGFNRRIGGEAFNDATYHSRGRSDYAGIAQGWNIAEEAINKGEIYYTHNMHTEGRCYAFPYGGTWVCNACGNSRLNKPWWNVRVFQDGNAWCCVGEGFEDLQASSNYAFGDTKEAAIANYRSLMSASPAERSDEL